MTETNDITEPETAGHDPLVAGLIDQDTEALDTTWESDDEHVRLTLICKTEPELTEVIAIFLMDRLADDRIDGIVAGDRDNGVVTVLLSLPRAGVDATAADAREIVAELVAARLLGEDDYTEDEES